MSFLISDALADTANGTQGAFGGLMSILPMIVLLVVFMYLMIIRPQSKKAKEHKNLISNLQKGDEIVTIGGILGKIEKIADDFLIIALSEGNKITIQKSAISNIVPHGTMKNIK